MLKGQMGNQQANVLVEKAIFQDRTKPWVESRLSIEARTCVSTHWSLELG